MYPGEPNKIVLITDGRNSLEEDDPVRVAEEFRSREPNGRISVIGIGRVNERLLEEIAGDSGYVLCLEDYIDLARIIDTLVCQVCGII